VERRRVLRVKGPLESWSRVSVLADRQHGVSVEQAVKAGGSACLTARAGPADRIAGAFHVFRNLPQQTAKVKSAFVTTATG